MTHEVDLSETKLTFRRLAVKLSTTKSIEDSTNMRLVLFEGLAVDQDIVKVDEQKVVDVRT
jgi:hypothetical protein